MHEVQRATVSPAASHMSGSVLNAAKEASLVQNTNSPIHSVIFSLEFLPENHPPMVVTQVTYMVADPIPKMRDPANMTGYVVASAKIAMPAVVVKVANNINFLGPS